MPGRRTGQGRAAKAGSYEVTFARPVRARWTRRRGRQIRARAAEAPVRIWGQTEPGSPPGTVNARRLVVAGRRTDHPCQISDHDSLACVALIGCRRGPIVICPHCDSNQTSRRRRCASLGYRSFACHACRSVFRERTGTPFNELQHPTDVVLRSHASEILQSRGGSPVRTTGGRLRPSRATSVRTWSSPRRFHTKRVNAEQSSRRSRSARRSCR